jgi:hypothetical protein
MIPERLFGSGGLLRLRAVADKAHGRGHSVRSVALARVS